MDTMLLHASQLKFIHPVSNLPVHVTAPLHAEFLRVIAMMGWEDKIKELY